MSKNDKRAQKVMGNANMKTKAKLAGIDVTDKAAYMEWISSQDISNEEFKKIMRQNQESPLGSWSGVSSMFDTP
jgi:hypothetical protein